MKLPTRWADNDQYGHLNNATYYSLFDTALTLWQMQAGFLSDAADAPRFLVVENGCLYHEELSFPETIIAGLRATHIGNSSFRLDLALFRGTAELAASTGFFAQVQVDQQTHKPTPLNAARRAILSSIS
ncbi:MULTISPECIES: acyl-CoA thioesterase [unclassified Marinovum]